jgi:hypothetical protein
MKNPASNITTLGNQASVRALSAQRRRRLRATRPEPVHQLRIVTDTGLPDLPAPKTGGRAILFEWGVLGTMWGAGLGLCFALILVPVALFGLNYVVVAAPTLITATLTTAIMLGAAGFVAGLVRHTSRKLDCIPFQARED